jgi:DNA-binding PadR family transcriptional regulator
MFSHSETTAQARCAASRCAIVETGMDDGLPLNEWVVLGLLAEQPRHGFALARELTAGSDLGRILTVHRPLVYRALDRLVAAGLASASRTEPGDNGPNRTVHAPTRRGTARLGTWLAEPVFHVRDLRLEFLVKVRLLERAGKETGILVAAQRNALAATLDGLVHASDRGDVVELWRSHNAAAAQAFLGALADR